MNPPGRSVTTAAALVGCWLAVAGAGASTDLSVVPFWDGETSNGLLNRYGGQPGAAFNLSLTETGFARTGGGAFALNTTGAINPGQIGFVQTRLTPNDNHRRDLTRFDATQFHVLNNTGTAFSLRFEIKDHRDSNAHTASWTQTINATTDWQPFTVPLDLSTPGLQVNGSPDLSQVGRFSYVVSPIGGQAVNGSILIDDGVFIEPGGPVDVQTAPLNTIVERLARRQWDGLWGSRNRTNGLLPLHNTSGGLGAMNTSSAVLKILPGAVQRGWVSQADADQHVTNLVGSLNTMLDSTSYLPPRYADWNTLAAAPGVGGEESSIDAAFMALALHQYKNAAGVSPSVASAVDTVQNRFNFQPFSDTVGSRQGWKFANRAGTGLTDGTYDGYSGEIWAISLAAHLSDSFHVPIEEQYHSGVFRSFDFVDNPNLVHAVHSFDQFRPPFVQWLFQLFADVSDRGNDTFPTAAFATNPHTNAVRYQQDVAAYFDSIGRGEQLQPDAGDNGSGQYEQYSAYNNFGSPDVFMPWAVAFALLGDEEAGEASLRALLEADLEGPFGLADSAVWATGASDPTSTPAFHDLWNTSLSTMALLEYLYGEAASFASLPEVSAALDRVFQSAGDYNGSGQVEQGDLDLVLQNWGRDTVAAGIPAGWFNDLPLGQIEQTELDRVLQNWGALSAPDFSGSNVPEPGVAALLGLALVGRRAGRRPRGV